MSRPTLVGFSANTSRPSKTQSLVTAIVTEIEARHRVNVELLDLVDVLPELARTTDPRLADPNVARLIETIEASDGLVVGTAVHKGAYSGLFKHLFDLIDPKALTSKPVILSATGGSERHALVIEHSMRPLFSFFNAAIIPTGIYATERDFVEGQPSHTSVIERIKRAAEEFGRFSVPQKPRLALARTA